MISAAGPPSGWNGRVPGCGVRPPSGPYHGFLITHEESLSIAEYLTLRTGDELLYRPTVRCLSTTCDDAVLSLHELAGGTGGSNRDNAS